MKQSFESRTLLTMRVDAANYASASNAVVAAVKRREAAYVCAANVHMVMECYDARQFTSVVNGAALIVPDGMPLVWSLRLLGVRSQQRVYGPTLMLHICAEAEREGIAIGLYGGSLECLGRLQVALLAKYPRLQISYMHSPPYRPLTDSEDADIVSEINDAGIGVLFVGLGCPKQEYWMAEHTNRVFPVMLGVGAAFAFHAGDVRQAPHWLQSLGLEWLFRLLMEPRRLWRRYLWNNPRFMWLIIWQHFAKGSVSRKRPE